MSTIAAVLQAEQRIRPHIVETPFRYSQFFSKKLKCETYLKLENLQHTGSFKVRGALNKLLSLDGKAHTGIVTASSGNHGAATAFALDKLSRQGKIFVPENASPAKTAAIAALGQTASYFGDDCVVTEKHARRYAAEKNLAYISPYNDPAIIAGQGTIGVEIARQIDSLDRLYITIGGGGMISGVAIFLKSVFPDVKIIACSPENSAVMIDSIAAGEILDIPSLPTLSDGSAGGVEENAITFPLCKQLIDDCVKVSEVEIAEAMRQFIDYEHLLPEGAAAVALAACIKQAPQVSGEKVGIIICGGNIDRETLKSIL